MRKLLFLHIYLPCLLRYVIGGSEILITNFDVFLKKLIEEKGEVSWLPDKYITFYNLSPDQKSNYKNEQNNKEEIKKILSVEVQKDLIVMLEKKFDQIDETVKCDFNRSETIEDKYNDISIKNNSPGNAVSEFNNKKSKEDKYFKNKYSISQLNFNDNLHHINSQQDPTVMDVQSRDTNNMCNSSYNAACSNSPDVCANTSSGKSESSKTECTLSSSAANNPSSEFGSEVNLQQTMNDVPSDSSSITSNKENAPPVAASIEIEIPPMSAISTMVGSAPIPATTASVQPLPSNIVNKTSFQMETQYMQQQSQIFVFSTALANKAAESYLSGNFPSIIAFHCAQPGTKSFLEKYPLKVQQFNRQNPAAWLNSLAQMKQPGNRQIKPSLNQFTGPHSVNNRFPGPFNTGNCMGCAGACSNMHCSGMCVTFRGSTPWSHNCNPGIPQNPNDMCPESWSPPQICVPVSPSSNNARFPGPVPHGINVRQAGPSGALLGCMRNMNPNASDLSFANAGLMHMSQIPGCQSTLTGVKVPDENLTPQQRQHREEQLAMIRKMQQLLFPEHQHGEQVGMIPNALPLIGELQSHSNSPHPRFPLTESCAHSGVDACLSPHQTPSTDAEHPHLTTDMCVDSSIVGTGFSNQNYPPITLSAQLEWQKLQHQFYEERRKKQVCDSTSSTNSSPTSQIQGTNTLQQQVTSPVHNTSQPLTPNQNLNSPSPGVGLSPSARIQGPPPPYHQSNRKTMPSPHPPSPSTALQSPHTTSGIQSPADTSKQFPVPTPPGARFSHPSPGSATPTGSLQTTPLNSPKPSTSCSSNVTHVLPTNALSNTISTPASTPVSSYVPVLSSSEPSTPLNSCALNQKQNQSCSDEQESDSQTVSTSGSSEFSTSVPVSSSKVKGELFTQDIHSCIQKSQKQEPSNQKEPNLMPVPSPQQIQYLNSFDGQELTIQKQANTSMKEISVSSACVIPLVTVTGGSQPHIQNSDACSFPNTPGSCPSALENSQDSLTGRYPSSAPASVESGISRLTDQSPQLPEIESGSRHSIQTPQITNDLQRFSSSQNIELVKIPPNSSSHNPLNDSMCKFPVVNNQVSTFESSVNGNVNISNFPESNLETLQNSSSQINIDSAQSPFLRSNSQISCDNYSEPIQFSNIRQENITSNESHTFSTSISGEKSPCMNKSFIDSMSHSHLHSLQKMTPPFENMTGSKFPSEGISSAHQCRNFSGNNSNVNVPSYGGMSSLTSSQVGPSQRIGHFDPIASMAAMSESTTSMTSVTGNSQILHTDNSSAKIQISCNSDNNSNSNFPTDMQSMSNTIVSSVSNQFSVHNETDRNIACGSQSISTTHANTTSSQLNMLNIISSPSYTTSGQSTHSHSFHTSCTGNGANTLSCSITTSHPIMHTAVTTRTSNSNIVSVSRHVPFNFSGQSGGQRNASPTSSGVSSFPRGLSFNSTNLQMKVNAPNSIQYLPARQQSSTAPAVSNRPPSIDFFQRFAAPLTNLDNKVPTHNLQYFPNSGNSHPPAQNINMSPVSGVPNIMSTQRPMSMMGPMMRGTNSNMSHLSGQIFPIGSPLPNSESQMFGRSPCPSMNNQLIPMNPLSGSQGPAMFSNKQMTIPIGGMAPDTTQPLPPSMSQSFNYKQSPFYGPTTADPNYAVQFHNFQQQLYATSTRGSQINSQSNISGQGFFGPK